jgi:hypothetical protein
MTEPRTVARHVRPPAPRPSRALEWLDALLSRPDSARAVRAMPAQEVYLAIRGLGLSDSLELLRLCSPEQLQACLDIDCWQRDQLVPERMLSWIAALTELGSARLARVVSSLDHELLVCFLRSYVQVYEHNEEEVPDEPEGHFYRTPDTFYTLDVKEPGGAIDRMLDALYAADLDLGRRVVMGARWDIGAETEEMAYRFRAGRMADLGYVDYYEALPIYAFLDPHTVHLNERSAPPFPEAGPEAEPTAPRALIPTEISDTLYDEGTAFGKALAQLHPAQHDALYEHLLLLVNQVLSADRVDPGDVAAARQVMERIAGALSLGVEYLGRQRAQAGAAEEEGLSEEARGVLALHRVSLPRLFRLGHSLTVQLQRLAHVLAERGLVTLAPKQDPASLMEPPYDDVIRKLRETRPLYCKLLDGDRDRAEGAKDAAGTGRPFRSLADIARTATALQAIGAQVRLLTEGLGVRIDNLAQVLASTSPDATEARLSDLLGTMAANLLLARPPSFVPLSRQDLPALRQAALGLSPTSPALSPTAHALVLSTLRERVRERTAAAGTDEADILSPPASRFLEHALARLAAGLFALPHDLPQESADLVARVPGLVLR